MTPGHRQPDSQAWSVLLADTQAISRQAMGLMLREQGYHVVAETASGSEAAQLAADLQVDALITDLELDVLPGLELIRQVRRSSPKTGILVLTQIEACASVIGAMRAGAGGYVLRNCQIEEFSRALDAVVHGDTYVCPRVAKHLVPGRCSQGDSADCQGLACLTARELQIVGLITQGYRSPQISSMLGITAPTVDRHRANIMRKLGIHSVSALVLFAVRAGLVDVHRASA